MEKYIVLFSTGLSSAMTLDKAINKFGTEKVIALFTDTKWEDEDNYRFMGDIKKRYPSLRFEYRADGRTPREVFLTTRWLGNSRLGNCSVQLKVKQTHKFLEEMNKKGVTSILLFGIGKHEEHRADSLKKKYPNYKCLFPLVEEPMTNEEMVKIIEGEWGIRIPRMYRLKFSHANCGGRCVRGGHKHWKQLYDIWPERFKEVEEIEEEFRRVINPNVTILTRTVRGHKQPLTLREFREELEWNLFQGVEDEEEEEICSVCMF